MKKILLILFIVTFSLVGKAQTYIPVIEENKYWQEFFWTISSSTSCNYEYAKLYFFEGDSTILGNTYKKLYYHVILPATPYGLCSYTYINFSFKVFTEKLYREDLDEKKIYIFEHPDIEYLVADFNLEIDDIYTHENPDEGGVPMTVTNIEDIIIETGEIRKRWEFEHNYAYLIEGLGYQGRIFNPFSNFIGSSYSIRCVHYFDTLLYKSVFGGQCAGHLSIEENEKNELEIKTYPNPVQDIFTIEFTENQNEPFQIQVFDVTGKLVLENHYEATQKVELNCQELNDGMYFYTITQNNGLNLGSGKMVIDF